MAIANCSFRHPRPDNIRLAYQVTDAEEHKIEGAQSVHDRRREAADEGFHFNDLELIPDQREYQPGQTVNLMVNTNRSGGTVLLFVRPVNGIYLKPKVLRLNGKSVLEEIAVTKKDMPNFFVEAVTIAGGKVFTESKQIVVPPEKRVVDVTVTPSSETYKPGQKATVDLKLTDSAGKPFVGSTVVAIYDKAVEYISGGSNVEDIKAFFWKWRRSHYPQTETNLGASILEFGAGQAAWDGRSGHVWRVGCKRNHAGQNSDRRCGRCRSRPPDDEPRHEFRRRACARIAAQPHLPPTRAEAPVAAGPLVQPTVRTNFADTALWVGAVTTDENGMAQVSLTMPENLTTWKVRVWGMGHGTSVGQGAAEVVTRKDLLVRLQAPRFFVEKDEVVLSANVHNYLKSAKRVSVALELDGKCLAAMTDANRQVEVPSGGEMRVDWRVKVVDEGEAVVRMKALSDEESDAVEQRFPVYVHGMLKTESFSGALRPDDTVGKITFKVPESAQAGAIAVGSAILADAGRRDGRCVAVPGRLSVWLHRANAESFLADSHHAANC